MRLTHFGHSCLLVELAGARILFDPGNFSTGFESLTDLDAILVTHQHPDHGDPERLPALVARNPGAALHCDPQSAALWNAVQGNPDQGNAGPGNADQRNPGLGGRRWQPASTGDAFTLGDVTVEVVGGVHAVIHEDIPVIDNACFILGTAERPGRFMHPGDALFAPERPIDVLALPATAPWMKLSETVDYFRAVRPRVAVPVHTAIASEFGLGIYFRQLTALGPADSEFLVLPQGAAVEV